MEKLYSRRETAELLGISVRTLDQAKAEGTIAYVQYADNGRVYFSESCIEEYIAKCTHKPMPIKPATTYRNVRKRY